MRFAMIDTKLFLTLTLDDSKNLIEGRICEIEAPDNTLCLVGILGDEEDPRVVYPAAFGKVQALIRLCNEDMEKFLDGQIAELEVDKVGKVYVVYEDALISFAISKNIRMVTIDQSVSTTIN